MKKKILSNLPLWCLMFIVLICLSSCGKSAKTEQAQKQVEQTQVMQVDQLLQDAEQLVDKTVQIEGVCTHICKHGGRKIFLMGSDDTQTIRIEGGAVGKFDAKCVNNLVQVTGTLKEQRIDEAYLLQWEEQVKAKTQEKHGENEAEGCSTEKKARQETGNSVDERIADFRARIAERQEKEGKAYLSFYYMEAESYAIAE